jgi:hypothetical protein
VLLLFLLYQTIPAQYVTYETSIIYTWERTIASLLFFLNPYILWNNEAKLGVLL